MGLEKLTKNVREIIYNFPPKLNISPKAGVFLLGTRFLDNLSTKIALSSGKFYELNPLINKYIETFGIDSGPLLSESIILPITFTIAHYMNKKEEDVGDIILYGVSLMSIPLILSNFANLCYYYL